MVICVSLVDERHHAKTIQKNGQNLLRLSACLRCKTPCVSRPLSRQSKVRRGTRAIRSARGHHRHNEHAYIYQYEHENSRKVPKKIRARVNGNIITVWALVWTSNGAYSLGHGGIYVIIKRHLPFFQKPTGEASTYVAMAGGTQNNGCRKKKTPDGLHTPVVDERISL